MSDARTFILVHSQARRGAMQCVAEAPEGFCVIVKPKTRSLEQNARLWAMLGEISQQVTWHGKKLSADAWKCVFSAASQEVEAYAHPDYQDLLQALRGAVEAEELARWKMVACQAAIEVWRSQEASGRAMDRATR